MERLVEQDAGIGQLRRGEQSFFRMPGNLASYRMRERAETDYRNAFKYATAKGRAEGRVETARNLLQMGLELDKISQATQLSLDEIKTIKARMPD
ncbi:hypothetical protein [uncultured Fretibacterium sp.]|uniref:hypothetical protein n=1 Tax=uncultured Fretibacterium sp. TaxID=1678694 RepID=UPI002625967B|nr:hypothetical protein [uncultured Fretibacterium sp.]